MLDTIISSNITLTSFLICTAVSLVLGVCSALVVIYRSKSTQSFALTSAVLPVGVQMAIMLVNGNIGAGVAVAGTFSLVRFRSAPGTAKEIIGIFLAMAIGMGYVALAALFFVIVAAFLLLLTTFDFCKGDEANRILRITIPENLDYEDLFADLLEKYAKTHSLDKVKTTNMGMLYALSYTLTLKTPNVPKEFLDEIRCRNGNLNVVCCKATEKDTL